MALAVCGNAICMCSFGAAPCTMNVLPVKQVMTSGPIANIEDGKILNLSTFGMCSSMGNPTVQSATAAALGVLTPMPCVPSFSAPWVPGAPTVLIGGKPAVNSDSKLICSYGGIVSISFPGQTTIMVP